jgi:hypothetical protein
MVAEMTQKQLQLSLLHLRDCSLSAGSTWPWNAYFGCL